MSEVETVDWAAGLVVDGKGNLTRSMGNAALILTHAPSWRGTLQYDTLLEIINWTRKPPAIHGFDTPTGQFGGDSDTLYIQVALAREFGVEFPVAGLYQAIELAARQFKMNRLQEYLLDLVWDGKPRVDGWLSTYLGAPNSEYEIQAGRMWLVGAIARAIRPGCKNDFVLVLEGKQGTGKSTTASILGGPFYLSKLPNLRYYEKAAHALLGKWIAEIGELDAFRGAAITQIKEYLTIEEDHFRSPYDRTFKTRKRTIAFIGTTNDATYLRDASGGRRFWPIRIRRLDRDALKRDRDQLWAEALRMFEDGQQWHPKDEHIHMFEREQEERQETDAWEDIISTYLEDKDNMRFTAADILSKALGLERSRWGLSEQQRVSSILKRLGFHKERKRVGGQREYIYTRTPPHHPPDE